MESRVFKELPDFCKPVSHTAGTAGGAARRPSGCAAQDRPTDALVLRGLRACPSDEERAAGRKDKKPTTRNTGYGEKGSETKEQRNDEGKHLGRKAKPTG